MNAPIPNNYIHIVLDRFVKTVRENCYNVLQLLHDYGWDRDAPPDDIANAIMNTFDYEKALLEFGENCRHLEKEDTLFCCLSLLGILEELEDEVCKKLDEAVNICKTNGFEWFVILKFENMGKEIENVIKRPFSKLKLTLSIAIDTYVAKVEDTC